MKKLNDNNKLAIQMRIAMISGILVGLLFMAARETMGDNSAVWATINNLLFQDITAKGAKSAIGLFYIGGQLFIRALQLVIVPPFITSNPILQKKKITFGALLFCSKSASGQNPAAWGLRKSGKYAKITKKL